MEESSSESPMEEGSIDGSEPEYDEDEYVIDGDDDDREDDYDDGADDDDDDMDDDEDSMPPTSSYEFDGLVNHFRFVNRIDAPHSTELEPRTSLNVLSWDNQRRDAVFDSRVMETVDWLTNLDSSSFWNFINTYAVSGSGGALHFPNPSAIPRSFSSRGAPGTVSAGFLGPDFPFARDSDSGLRVHPALHRPSAPSSSAEPFRGGVEPATLDVLLPGSSLFGPSARRFASINIELRSQVEPRFGDVALDDALTSIASLAQLLSGSNTATMPLQSEVANGPESTQDQSNNRASAPSDNTSQQEHSNVDADDVVPLIEADASGSIRADPSSDDRVPSREASVVLSSGSLSLPMGSGPPFFLPSQVAARGDPFGPAGFSALARRPFGARMSRERDRSSSSRRWTYDPPGNGGDDLPSMFSGGSSNQRGQQSSERRNSSTPFTVIAAESFESVNKLETKIIERLSTLTSDLRKIDSNVKQKISDVTKRFEKEKKQEVEKSKLKESTGAEPLNVTSPQSPEVLVNVSPDFNEAQQEDPFSNEEMIERQPGGNLSGGLTSSRTPEQDDAMQTEENERQDNSNTEREGEPSGPTNEPIAAVNLDAIEVDSPDGDQPFDVADGTGSTNLETIVANAEFPSVAAARAAAIGISLDAPASSDPGVIEAALQSTGIDPTFLSALPESMRSEVFNQLFDQMRTDPNTGGTAEQPVSTLSQDFLIALPPELRAEVLEAEVAYQSRNAPPENTNADDVNDGNTGANAPSNGPGAEMDNATFLATLPRQLREEVLVSLEEDVLEGLPPALAMEARSLREREAAHRVREQAHGWGSPDETPVMFRREMYSGIPIGRRERETRVSRRSEPGMRWERIDGHWYRVGPKPEDDVKSSLNGEALSSIVQLLRLRQSSFGKVTVFSVLACACKNIPARKQVLTELLTMITGDKEGRTGVSEEEISTVFASQGTVVRRALELLAQLCKSDDSISETLIGLPSPRSELSPHEVQPKRLDSGNRLLSLSTLTSLLSTPLFMRSNSHLDQLLSIISFVCRAFPSSRQGKSKRTKLRSMLGSVSALTNILGRIGEENDDDDDDDLMARREFLDHLEEGLAHGERGIGSDEQAEAERQLMESMDIRQTVRRMRRHRILSAPDSDDSSDDDEQEPGEAQVDTSDYTARRLSSQEGTDVPPDTAREPGDPLPDSSNDAAGHVELENNAEGQTSTANNANAQNTSGGTNDEDERNKKKKEKKPEIRVPVEYRVPHLSEKDLNALVIILRRAGCTDWVYEAVSNALGQLGELPANRSVTITALAKSAKDLGCSVMKAYENLKGELDTCGKQPKLDAMKKKQIISRFVMSGFSSELMLLRLVKTASTLLDISSKKEKPTKSTNTESDEKTEPSKLEDPPMDSTILAELRESKDQVFRGLQDLWVSLYEILDLVESELDISTRDRKNGSSRSTYVARRRNESLARQTRTRNSRKSLTPVLARLSPTIEAFFITHSTLMEEDDEAASVSEMVSSPRPMSPFDGKDFVGSSRASDSMDSQCLKSSYQELGNFLSRHRVPVNALLRANPTLLESSFKMALKHPQTIDFDNKKSYFRSLIRKRGSNSHASTLRIHVRRDYVYNDTYHNLRSKTKEEMKGRLHVQFTGEEGIDAGGVTREWYTILARQIFDPNYALFCRSAAKAATYQPDKRSCINPEHLENFKFVGRVIAKAIYDGQLIDAYFTRAFYKHILGVKPTYHDIEAQDPDYYKSLKWMLENDITGVLDNTMSAEYEEFGERKVVDLIPNGRSVAVTQENKSEYVRAVTEVRLTKAIEKQIEAFKEGFHELIPLDDCKIFNEVELELLMSGLPDIDMADLKANVEYNGYTSSSPQVNWFWRCVSKMDQEDLARLVMFVTGTSKVPLEGFSALQGMNGAQKFQIHRVSGDTNRLPSAHTCFNQLDLPEYGSPELLAEQVLKAVRECHVGFGFA